MSALDHSRPQRPRFFWSSEKALFPEHAQSNRFVFSTNQVCQTWLWACMKKGVLKKCSCSIVKGNETFREYPLRQSQKMPFTLSMHRVTESPWNNGLPVLNLPRSRDSWCWPKGAWPLRTRTAREKFDEKKETLRLLQRIFCQTSVVPPSWLTCDWNSKLVISFFFPQYSTYSLNSLITCDLSVRNDKAL